MERPQLTRRSTAPTSLVNVSCRVCGARELVIVCEGCAYLCVCARGVREGWVCVFLRTKDKSFASNLISVHGQHGDSRLGRSCR